MTQAIELRPVLRATELTVPATQVAEGDRIWGTTVTASVQDPAANWVWRIEGEAMLIRINRDAPVEIIRDIPLEDGQCLECGRLDSVKYAAQRLCGACYARKHRSKAQ